MTDLAAPLPCGRRDPACTRPDACDDCLPRDRRQLHDRILTRCDPAWYGLRDNPIRLFAAMRAVVERHSPRQCAGFPCLHLDPHPVCVACGQADPCDELTTIARELGIKENRD